MTVEKKIRGANPDPFLSTIGKDGHLLSFPKKRTIFAQRDASDGLFFVQQGNVRKRSIVFMNLSSRLNTGRKQRGSANMSLPSSTNTSAPARNLAPDTLTGIWVVWALQQADRLDPLVKSP